MLRVEVDVNVDLGWAATGFGPRETVNSISLNQRSQALVPVLAPAVLESG
jgi:hypothetical protein